MLGTYLRWCAQQGIKLDSRLSIRAPLDHDGSLETSDALAAEESKPGVHGLCVFAKGFINNHEIVATIPKSAILSARNFRYAGALAEFLSGKEVDPILRLSLVLCIERKLGQASKWWGYIQGLPIERTDLAAFWLLEPNNDDTQEALRCLGGTELLGFMSRDAEVSLLAIHHFLNTVVLPFCTGVGSGTITLDDFYYAFSMVSSRTFHVDDYHGIALVPIADAFNHVDENTVHLETDYFVCAICGSLDECPHDADGCRANTTNLTTSTSEEDCCEMVTNAVLYGGEEIFNTYDRRLSNVKLMLQYGFLLDGNSYDEILLTIHQVEGYLANSDSGRIYLPVQFLDELWEYLFDQNRWVRYLPTSTPFFSPLIDEEEGDKDDPADGERWKKHLFSNGSDNSRFSAAFFAINADAQISQALWLYLVLRRAPEAVISIELPSLFVVRGPDDMLLGYLNTLAGAIYSLDLEDGHEEYEMQNTTPLSGVYSALGAIVDDILTISRSRLASIHLGDQPTSEISDLIGMLQSAEERRPRTELALRFALNEKLILESCIKNWEEIKTQIEECNI